MGRASLFLCGGFAIILGIIQLNIQNSQLSQTGLNIDYANQSQARNLAMSGMQMGIRKIVEDFDWRPDPSPWIITISGNTTDVFVDDNESHPDELTPMKLE